MKYIIRGKNIEITEAMKNHIQTEFDKLEKFEQIHSDDTVKFDIRFYNENMARVTAVIDIIGKNNFCKADVEDADFYKAVEKARKEIERQIKRIKERSHESFKYNQKLSEAIVKMDSKNKDDHHNDEDDE